MICNDNAMPFFSQAPNLLAFSFYLVCSTSILHSLRCAFRLEWLISFFLRSFALAFLGSFGNRGPQSWLTDYLSIIAKHDEGDGGGERCQAEPRVPLLFCSSLQFLPLPPKTDCSVMRRPPVWSAMCEEIRG
jgi:hypothetical protein